MATDILGKIGEKVATQINTVNANITNNLATKVSLGTTDGNVASLQNTKADKLSLANFADGTSVFSLIKGTRAELGSLKVSGDMTVVNTQTVEVSDNFLELNKAEDGSETANTSGISINTGKTSGVDNPKAKLEWNDTSQKWFVRYGDSGLADIQANTFIGDVTGDLTGSVDATSGTVSIADGTGLLVNGVELGDYASFETEFLNAL